MKYRAPHRLFRALLFEMTSGNYKAGQKFLSHRRIMRHWQVSTPTANKTLLLLREAGLLSVIDSSGHYLCDGFREKALLLLASEPEQPGKQTKVREPMFRARLISGREQGGARALRVGVVLFRPGLKMRWRAEIETSSGLDAGASLTARSIFRQGEEHKSLLDFIACSGKPTEVEAVRERLLRTSPDGVIFLCRTPGLEVAALGEALLQQFIPVVSLFNDSEGTDMVSVNFNNIGMGAHAADILAEAGHQRVAILEPPGKERNYLERAQGCRQRLRERSGEPISIIVDPWTKGEEMKKTVARIVRSGCTALYSTGHQFMEGVLPWLNASARPALARLSLLSTSSTPEVSTSPDKVDILHMDFEGLGHLAFRALRDYRRGEVAQKCYLLTPPYRAFGTVRPPVRE